MKLNAVRIERSAVNNEYFNDYANREKVIAIEARAIGGKYMPVSCLQAPALFSVLPNIRNTKTTSILIKKNNPYEGRYLMCTLGDGAGPPARCKINQAEEKKQTEKKKNSSLLSRIDFRP